jgi:8-oxo-dGTP pyrophosphatase MutT (NUDIX family)
MKFASKAIIIKNNKYLLQLMDNTKNILFPNHWCFFGGTLKKKETPEICIKREIKEELSIKIKIIMKIYECLSSKTNTYLNYFYTDPLDIIRTKNLAEGQKLAWFSKDKLKKLKRSPDVLIFEEYLN